LALLEEARLIHDQHRIRRAQRLDHMVADDIAQGVRIPAAAPQHGLLAPRAGVAGGLGAHPARLAPLGPEQAIEESARRRGDARRGEQGADPLLGLVQGGRPQLQGGFECGSRHGILPSKPLR
jgi:hypothetical protein